MTVMEGHAPVLVGLRPGIVRATGAAGSKAYVVTGGFAEVNATGVTVLAEQAIPTEEASAAVMDKLMADAAVAASVNPNRDDADKTMADLGALKAALSVH